MKKIFVLLFIGILCIRYSFPGTRAEVISKTGQWLTIDKGSTDGVKIGMTGIVKTIMVESGKTYDINVGLFEIKKVKEKTSDAFITELARGMNPGQAKYVVFDENLVPPSKNASSTNKTQESIQKAGITKHTSPTETIPSGKSIDWYLEKGDECYNKGEYDAAQKYYQHMLKIDPADPIAPKKISACEEMINRSKEERQFYSYIERADKYYSQGKIDYALEYYLSAYKSLPSKGKEVAVKFKTVSESYPVEWKKFQGENISDLEPLDRYFIPPGMPKEVIAMKSKAKKVYKNETGYWEAEFDYGIVMIYIPEGEFLMGSNDDNIDEKPIHTVFLDGYWIGKYEVTQGQWKEIMGNNPSYFKNGDDYPVEQVSWSDVEQFIQKLNSSSRSGLSFRLPTEAEWEKAARGTDQRKYPWGNAEPSCALANYGDCNSQPKPVGNYPLGVSPYGVHDMAGNVWEWCSDWYSLSYYSSSQRNNPTGPFSGSYRVIRSGSWDSDVRDLRCTNRYVAYPFGPFDRSSGLGFRLCMN